jgi:hypothetical protein
MYSDSLRNAIDAYRDRIHYITKICEKIPESSKLTHFYQPKLTIQLKKGKINKQTMLPQNRVIS